MTTDEAANRMLQATITDLIIMEALLIAEVERLKEELSLKGVMDALRTENEQLRAAAMKEGGDG